MKRLALLALLMCVAASMPCNAADIEWFGTYHHTSDIARGVPFNDRDEWSVDYVGFGMTLSAGKFEIDLSHGVKRLSFSGDTEQGTELAVRWYPKR